MRAQKKSFLFTYIKYENSDLLISCASILLNGLNQVEIIIMVSLVYIIIKIMIIVIFNIHNLINKLQDEQK